VNDDELGEAMLSVEQPVTLFVEVGDGEAVEIGRAAGITLSQVRSEPEDLRGRTSVSYQLLLKAPLGRIIYDPAHPSTPERQGLPTSGRPSIEVRR
jgi:hypothetical protein